MPPELLFADPYGLPGDVWGLGCVLFAMITFEPPFWHEKSSVRNERVCYEKLDLDNVTKGIMLQMSPQCKDLIKNLLRKNPARRPTIDQVLQHPWFEMHFV